MAEQILRAAAHGVYHQDELSQIAVKAATGKQHDVALTISPLQS
jgi:hypothetical protein